MSKIKRKSVIAVCFIILVFCLGFGKGGADICVAGDGGEDSAGSAASIVTRVITSPPLDEPLLPQGHAEEHTEEQTEETAVTAVTADLEIISEPQVKMLFGGDVLFDRSVDRLMREHGLTYPVSTRLTAFLRSACIVGINLEMPFSERGVPMEGKLFNFRGRPETAELLEIMRVNYCALANNHMLDYGEIAMLDTIALLSSRNIGFSGAGENLEAASRPAKYEINGQRTAIFSVSRVLPNRDWHATERSPGLFSAYEPENIMNALESAKETSDFRVVYVHWGIERNETPEEYQRELAYLLIESGADLVIGTHPHVLQGFEFYKGKLIAYSIGNFIFTDWHMDTALLQVLLYGDGSMTASIIPCRITACSTDFMPEEERGELFEHLTRLSYNAQIDGSGILKPRYNY